MGNCPQPPADGAAGARRRARRRVWGKWLFAALLLPLFAFALSRLDAQSLLRSAAQIPPWLAALLLGLQVVSQLLVNLQWSQIARFSDARLSFGKMLYINCQGSVVDAITPGVKIGGEVARAAQISRMGNCSAEQAAAAVALQKLFSLGAFFFVGLFAVWRLAGSAPWLAGGARFFAYGALLFFLLLFAAVFLAPLRIKARLEARKAPRFSWARRARGFLLALLDQVASVRKNAKAMAALSLLSLLIWLLYPAKMYLLAAQFFPCAAADQIGMEQIGAAPIEAAPIGAAQIGAATLAAYAVAMIPIFPGGLGGFEGAMSALLLAMGFPASDAVVATALFRFVTFWFVMLMSLGVIGFCKIARAWRIAPRPPLSR